MPYEQLDSFITNEDLGAYLGRDLSEDAMAATAADAACAIVRGAAEQRFDIVDDEEVLVDGSGTDTLLLPELPVVDVTAVLEGDTELDPATYIVDRARGAVVHKTGAWRPGRGNFTVTYSHGFEEVPADVIIVALTVAARIYEQGIVKQESVGGYSATFASDDPVGLTRRERDIIAKYRPVRSAPTYDA